MAVAAAVVDSADNSFVKSRIKSGKLLDLLLHILYSCHSALIVDPVECSCQLGCW